MSRNLTCFDEEGGRPARPHLCLAGAAGQPDEPLVRRCSLACKDQCRTSPWSSWSSCQAEGCFPGQPGPVKGTQVRTRSMSNPGGERTSCPGLAEVRSCRVESCYSWQVVEQGPCRLESSNAVCGVGKRRLEAQCLQWDGKPANASLGCASLQRPRKKEECSVPCPHDCIVSPWSPWSSCPAPLCPTPHHQQRLPLRQRNRTILATAGTDGRTCPSIDSLLEMAACPTLSGQCEWFSWASTPWTSCQLAPGDIKSSCSASTCQSPPCIRLSVRQRSENPPTALPGQLRCTST